MRCAVAALSLIVSLALSMSAHAGARRSLLRMRPAEPTAPARDVTAPTAVAWPKESKEPEQPAPQREAAEPADEGKERPPPPRPVASEQIGVAVGLSPEAPGSKSERAWLSTLEKTVLASTDPQTRVRRLRLGAGDAARICRQRREDLVIVIGYEAERPEPAVLAHDCRLDVALASRPLAAIEEPELVSVLWDEHQALVDGGMRERRFVRPLGRKARIAVVAGVALAVVGVAVGVLVASALREETIVLKVGP